MGHVPRTLYSIRLETWPNTKRARVVINQIGDQWQHATSAAVDVLSSYPGHVPWIVRLEALVRLRTIVLRVPASADRHPPKSVGLTPR